MHRGNTTYETLSTKLEARSLFITPRNEESLYYGEIDARFLVPRNDRWKHETQNLKSKIVNLNSSIVNLKSLLFLILTLFATNSIAQVETTKAAADQAFVEERYADAIEGYEDILTQEYVSAEVYYNLGNAYFKDGKIAPSILNYERALKLAPKDEDIQFNLKLVNLSVKDRIEEIPQLFFVNWWNAIVSTFSTDGWAWSAVISFVLALAGFLLFRLSNEEGMKRLTFYTGVIALLWFSFSIYSAEKSFNHAVNDNRAVVFASTINAKSSPNEKGKDLFVIHEGLVVKVSDELNGWIRIKLSNGNVGWIPRNTVVSI